MTRQTQNLHVIGLWFFLNIRTSASCVSRKKFARTSTGPRRPACPSFRTTEDERSQNVENLIYSATTEGRFFFFFCTEDKTPSDKVPSSQDLYRPVSTQHGTCGSRVGGSITDPLTPPFVCSDMTPAGFCHLPHLHVLLWRKVETSEGSSGPGVPRATQSSGTSSQNIQNNLKTGPPTGSGPSALSVITWHHTDELTRLRLLSHDGDLNVPVRLLQWR